MDIKVKTEIDKKNVIKAVKQASIPRIKRAAFLVEREAKLSMKRGGRGTGARGGKTYLPAPPGMPPHVQTGNLRASIQSGPTQRGTYVVGPTLQAWYGRLLEIGSRVMKKRPFMRPALQRAQRLFPAMFKDLHLARTRAGRILNKAKGLL